jgi:hypothetical protein
MAMTNMTWRSVFSDRYRIADNDRYVATLHHQALENSKPWTGAAWDRKKLSYIIEPTRFRRPSDFQKRLERNTKSK